MCLGVPGQIKSLTCEDDLFREGVVNFNGIRKTVNLSLVPDACIDDYVIVHAGFAITKLDSIEAHKSMDLYQQMVQEESK